MSADVKEHPRDGVPTLTGALAFRAKSALFQLRRCALNLLVYKHARHRRADALAGKGVVAESRTKLWAEGEGSESFMQAGKVHNLRLALRRLDGLEVPAGAVFSFWAHVGRASRGRGYGRGRELREGCVIPSVGGGLCQLSNALYDAALQAGFEIVERHSHTRIVPGSQAEAGRDATVFWNYVDLRWRSPHP
ncbi:MAG: VanW family protein, partial [Rubrivivax sp.]|nr:VanW family protein [Pyrinomonadaceae bacterium]